ncbi:MULTISPECIES: hypothetical protein [unclassified Sedimentibacter]|uniref:hypothetical protein n=1 Tax=unclassified Sedimentibacter TaxID=2649220 RepID=UPI0027DF6B61|nr:hypothetical protein [Sedimentibacter sp. MB35-C1]WMJ78382.1 hypothetical protein RBQ61_05450 [Sedimentibacter sp. MB35-C1]
MENFVPEDIETNEVKSQCDCDRIGGRRQAPPCIKDEVLDCTSNTNLLWFFLLLVAIVCQSNCNIDLNALLWFFLLLVVIYNNYY